MPFNYQSLKNLSSASLVDTTITGAELDNNSVITDKLAASTITADEIASSSIDLAGSVVTGSVSSAKGGTGLAGFAGAYRALTVNSSNNAYVLENTGIRAMQVFTGSGTWSKPSGVRFVHVQILAGGGGGGGHGESGAAGGYAEKIVDVTGISSVSITIGGGRGGTYYNNAGGNGASSSFGPYVSAGGGHGCNRHNNHNGGLSGVGSGGDLNLYQGCGGGHEQRSSGMGGGTYFGGPGPAGHPQGGNFAHNHQGHSAPGTGGTGGYFHGIRGSDGKNGLVLVEHYK